MTGTPGTRPHEVTYALTNALVASRSLHVIAELGVADHIGDAPVSTEDLAAECGAVPDALDRVLALLVTHGIFELCGGGYRHTEASLLLRTDHPMSLRAFARMMGLPGFLGMFDRLEHSVRTGTPAATLVDPDGLWSYLQSHPGEAEVFGQAMTAKAAADIAGVVGAYDFGRFATIADVGGGRGHLLRAVLDATPAAKGILFELPDVVSRLDSGATSDRMSLRAGDFFVDPLPAADAYILMEVIHDWADTESIAILRAVRRAAFPGARVLVIENVLADGAADRRGRTLDVIMLAVTGGRERTVNDLDRILAAAGFDGTTVIETGGPLRIVEATAA